MEHPHRVSLFGRPACGGRLPLPPNAVVGDDGGRDGGPPRRRRPNGKATPPRARTTGVGAPVQPTPNAPVAPPMPDTPAAGGAARRARGAPRRWPPPWRRPSPSVGGATRDLGRRRLPACSAAPARAARRRRASRSRRRRSGWPAAAAVPRACPAVCPSVAAASEGAAPPVRGRGTGSEGGRGERRGRPPRCAVRRPSPGVVAVPHRAAGTGAPCGAAASPPPHRCGTRLPAPTPTAWSCRRHAREVKPAPHARPPPPPSAGAPRA